MADAVEQRDDAAGAPEPDQDGGRGRLATRRAGGHRARRAALTAFFGSVAVNAVLGIVGLAVGDLGSTAGKLLTTSLSVTGALVLALLCLPAWERRRLEPVPAAAAAVGTLAFGLAVAAVWADGVGDAYGKVMGTTFALAAAGVVASLLVLADLAPRHRVALRAALVLDALGAAGVIGGIWLEPEGDWYSRALGVVLILLAALTVTIPVLHRLDRGAVATSREGAPVAFCPYCAEPLAGRESVELACQRCGRAFRVVGAPAGRTGSSSDPEAGSPRT